MLPEATLQVPPHVALDTAEVCPVPNSTREADEIGLVTLTEQKVTLVP